MKVDTIQLCQGPDVVAELKDDSCGTRTWYVSVRGDSGQWRDEQVDDEKEKAQLYHCLSGDFTGYMVFRAKEYEDVQICVLF